MGEQTMEGFQSAKIKGLWGVLIWLCVATAASAQSGIQLELPVIINKAYVGDITARLETIDQDGEDGSAHTAVIIPIARFEELVENFANDEQLQQWLTEPLPETGATPSASTPERNAIAATSIYLADLRSRGLDINFDPALLNITASVPRLGQQTLSVRGRERPRLDDHYEQSKVASGLSFYFRDTYNHKSAGGQPEGFSGLSADILGFTSIGGFDGWSLLYQGDYIEQEDRKLALRDISLLHNDYDRGLRYAIGDVRPIISRFQTGTDLLGISVERDYAEINPFRNLRPSGRSVFTLERVSQVSFEVNGAIVSTQELQPGSYSISDFPLAVGANDVRIWIDEGTARVEVASFSNYVDTTLLGQDIVNFGLNLGVQRERGTGRSPRYLDDPVFVGFYEKGLRENLTLGVNWELAEENALIAPNAIYGTRFGILALEAAVSQRSGQDTGLAALLRYAYQGISESNWFIRNDIQLSYRSDDFMSIADTMPQAREKSLNARTSFGRAGTSITLGGEIRQLDDIETTRLSATLTKIFASFSLSLSYQRTKSDSDDGNSDDRVTVSLSKRLGDSRLRAQYSSDPKESQLEWRSKVSRNVGDIRSRVAVKSNDDSRDTELELGYINSRFEMDLRHRRSDADNDDNSDTSSTNLTLGGGVGYADGKWAVGRPFTRGFIVVDRHSTLEGKKVAVLRGSTKGDEITSTKRMDTTLVPLSNNYRTQRYLFSIDELPLGYDIGSGDVKVYPGQLAGYKVTLGSEAANTVIGRLLSPDGVPLSLASGKLIKTSDAEGDAVTEVIIFTNRTGRFVAEKMDAGEYRIEISNQQWSGLINIKQGDEPGLIRVGDILLEETQ